MRLLLGKMRECREVTLLGGLDDGTGWRPAAARVHGPTKKCLPSAGCVPPASTMATDRADTQTLPRTELGLLSLEHSRYCTTHRPR